MWPVDEVDDGEEPPVPDFIATEVRIGAHHHQLLGVILSRGEGVWGGMRIGGVISCAGRTS
jgi:hypothetical protein